MDVLIKPLNTEKTAKLQGLNQYVFLVNKKANKLQVTLAEGDIIDIFNN